MVSSGGVIKSFRVILVGLDSVCYKFELFCFCYI